MKTLFKTYDKIIVSSTIILFALLGIQTANSQVQLISEIKVTDEALYFDGVKNQSSTNDDNNIIVLLTIILS